MPTLEMIIFGRSRLPVNAMNEGVREDEQVKMAGWVYGSSSDTIMVASAITNDGPRGVAVIPKASIISRTELVGYISSEDIVGNRSANNDQEN